MTPGQHNLRRIIFLFIAFLLAACSGGGGGGSGGGSSNSGSTTTLSLNLLADLNETPIGPDTRIGDPAELNGWLYFSADDGVNGIELWRTDGTTTELVEDINPFDSSFPSEMTAFDGWVYFTAHNGADGKELMRSNGSTTEVVADLNPGEAGSDPRRLMLFNGNLYFIARTATGGDQLWRTDGSSITNVTDLDSTDVGTHNYYLTEVNGFLYFIANIDAAGWEVWRTNGTAVSRVTDVNNNPSVNGGNSSPSNLIALGNELFFNANDDTNTRRLWRTDGATTSFVSDVTLGAGNSGSKYAFNGWIYFSGDDGVAGNELWRTDGTTTELFFDRMNGALDSTPGVFVVLGGEMYFNSLGAVYRTDGTVAPTVVSGAPGLRSYTVHGGYIYYTGNDGSGNRLWRINGTSSEIYGGDAVYFYGGDSPPIVSFAGEVYFAAYDNNTLDARQWWRTTPTGVEVATDINNVAYTQASYPIDIAEGQNYTYVATDAATPELWRVAGASKEKIDLNSAYEGGRFLVEFNGYLYFVDFSPGFGTELWRTNWTLTERFTDINAADGSSSPNDPVIFGGYLWFSANDGVNGRTLWRTDGTTTEQVLDGATNPVLNPGDFYEFNNYLYFTASSPGGSYLWRTNGTTTEEVLKSGTNTQISRPFGFTTVGNNLFFVAIDLDTGNGREIWTTDSTTTNPVSNINPAAGENIVRDLEAMDDFLYFIVVDSATDATTLWRANTASATELIPLNKVEDDLVAYKGYLYYTGEDVEHGYEIWRTDGVTAELFADINPGAEDSWAIDFFVFKGFLVFMADDGGKYGAELRYTDGTTISLAGNPSKRGGTWPNYPLEITSNRIYYEIDDDIHDVEPWYLE